MWYDMIRQVVYEKCHHPFVRHMDYALQTEQYAIIVLNLITTGSIQVDPGSRALPNTFYL